jgi:predicted nucleotidyltransferase
MDAAVTAILEAVAAELGRHPEVAAAYLFGSMARGTTGPERDEIATRGMAAALRRRAR